MIVTVLTAKLVSVLSDSLESGVFNFARNIEFQEGIGHRISYRRSPQRQHLLRLRRPDGNSGLLYNSPKSGDRFEERSDEQGGKDDEGGDQGDGKERLGNDVSGVHLALLQEEPKEHVDEIDAERPLVQKMQNLPGGSLVASARSEEARDQEEDAHPTDINMTKGQRGLTR
ncbi:MAG: hypothetical protein M1376_03290 [Planctomycetes bacterium]|nr:hypothetical protein [Planctomycetota bacterium]